MTSIEELAELKQQVQSLLDANAELHGDYLAAVKERDELRVAVGAAKASIKAIAALSSREMRGDVVAEIKYICRDFLANANQIEGGE